MSLQSYLAGVRDPALIGKRGLSTLPLALSLLLVFGMEFSIQASAAAGVVLGVHSNVEPDAGMTDGHAWISLTENGTTTRYGLWPDDHPAFPGNPGESDVHTNREPATGCWNRYYKLTAQQLQAVTTFINMNHSWSCTNNCASFASDAVDAAVGEDVDADDWWGFETPRELSESIMELEASDPTTAINGSAGHQGGSCLPSGGGSSCGSSGLRGEPPLLCSFEGAACDICGDGLCGGDENELSCPLDCLNASGCGSLLLTQLLDPTLVEAGTGVACPAPQDNFWARCFDLSVGQLTGRSISLTCVDVGVEANTRPGYAITVNLYLDSNGCPPDSVGMGVPIASMPVPVPDNAANVIVTATFASPIAIPADSRLIVEVLAPGAGQTGSFFIGGNDDGQSGISYIKSAGCGIVEYVDIDTVNAGQFAGSGWLLNIGYDCAEATACCLGNGTCVTVPAADCLTAGGDPATCGLSCGLVVCETGACCHDGVCEVLTPSACRDIGGRYKGGETACSIGECSGACCTEATCSDNVAQENCEAANQRYRGDGTTCAGSPSCSGGCCDGTTCTNGIAPASCPGRYLGDGVACAPAGAGSASCAAPGIPTLSEWGVLVLAALVAGAGAVTLLRRRDATMTRS